MFGLAPWRKREVNAIRNEIEEMFDRFFREYELFSFPSTSWMPSVDVSQTEDSVVVRMELPGMDPKDLDIYLHNDELVIQGEKKRERSDSQESFHRTECFCGKFQRKVTLPAMVDPDRVEAVYDKGILRIVMAKYRPVAGGKITIDVH